MKQTESHVLPGTGERFLPEFEGSIVAEHLHRYLLASQYVEGKRVLDIACGEGYGSHLLAQRAESVVGVDIDRDSVAHANDTYQHENLDYRVGDCSDIPLPDATFDVVVSFETIEHHDKHVEMMQEIKRVLRPGGLLIISSPDRYEYSTVRGFANPYHVHELDRHEFDALLGQHFSNHALLGQRVIYASAIVSGQATSSPLRTYNREDVAGTDGLGAPMYWFALASDDALPDVSDSLFSYPVEQSDAALEGERERARLQEELSHYQTAIDERDTRIRAIQDAIDGQTQALNARDQRIAELEHNAGYHDGELEAYGATIGDLREALAECERNRDALKAQLAESEQARDALHLEAQTSGWLVADYFVILSRIQAPIWLAKRLAARLLKWPGEYRRARDERRRIAESGLFDAEWYRQKNADVHSRGLDPLTHYQRYGGYEGRAASPDFDTFSYLRQHPELIAQRKHPLLHYLTHHQVGSAATDEQGTPSEGGVLFPELFQGAAQASPDYVAPTEHHLEGDTRIRAIAFYLPQFHPIAENNRWWGKGFTEWTNVSKAVPQFVGHEQPRLPGELGFYDLRIPEVQERQVELARQHGIEAFCFHYYWFSGRKRLLERPIDQYVANPNIDFPFCLCWANENWTRRWDGQENDILMEQRHEPQDDREFIEDIAAMLEDPRYLRVDGKPVLIVYRVDIIPDAARMADTWRKYCRERGIGELHLVAAQSFGIGDPAPYGFDAAVEFPPHGLHARQIEGELTFYNPEFAGRVYDYRDVVNAQLAKPAPDYRLYRSVFPAWDNEARKPGRGHIFHYATPGNYRRWLAGACDHADQYDGDGKLVFINAWNEWAEGAYLEPDRRHGYAYLQATQEVLAHYPVAERAQAPETIPAMVEPQRKHDTAVILHLYYPELWAEISPWLAHFEGNYDLYVTIPEQAGADTEAMLAHDVAGVHVARVPNRGRDIAPFLEILRAIQPLGYRQVCKLHAKRSIHREDGDSWRRDMLDSLVGSPRRVSEIERAFAERPELGMVGPAGHWLAYDSYWGIYPESLARVDALLLALGETQPTKGLHFFAGSMFWCRPEALGSLLDVVGWEDFEAELAQRDGAMGHAVERIAARACQLADYQVADTRAPAETGAQPETAPHYRYAAPCPPPDIDSGSPAQTGGERGAVYTRLRQLARKSSLARRVRQKVLQRIS